VVHLDDHDRVSCAIAMMVLAITDVNDGMGRGEKSARSLFIMIRMGMRCGVVNCGQLVGSIALDGILTLRMRFERPMMDE